MCQICIRLHCLCYISLTLYHLPIFTYCGCVFKRLCFASRYAELHRFALRYVALRCVALLFSLLLRFPLLHFVPLFYPGSYKRAREDYRWTGSRITASWNEGGPETSRISKEIRAKDPVLNEQTARCWVKWGTRWENNVRWIRNPSRQHLFYEIAFLSPGQAITIDVLALFNRGGWRFREVAQSACANCNDFLLA